MSLYTLCKNESIIELLNGTAFVRELLLVQLEISSNFPYVPTHSQCKSRSHSDGVSDQPKRRVGGEEGAEHIPTCLSGIPSRIFGRHLPGAPAKEPKYIYIYVLYSII